jgi:hypothetical protein
VAAAWRGPGMVAVRPHMCEGCYGRLADKLY